MKIILLIILSLYAYSTECNLHYKNTIYTVRNIVNYSGLTNYRILINVKDIQKISGKESELNYLKTQNISYIYLNADYIECKD